MQLKAYFNDRILQNMEVVSSVSVNCTCAFNSFVLFRSLINDDDDNNNNNDNDNNNNNNNNFFDFEAFLQVPIHLQIKE